MGAAAAAVNDDDKTAQNARVLLADDVQFLTCSLSKANKSILTVPGTLLLNDYQAHSVHACMNADAGRER